MAGPLGENAGEGGGWARGTGSWGEGGEGQGAVEGGGGRKIGESVTTGSK